MHQYSFHCVCELGGGNLRLARTNWNIFKGGDWGGICGAYSCDVG